MTKGKVIELRGPEGTRDALTELLRTGARKLLEEAVTAELEEFLAAHRERRLPDGRAQVVRNGFLPEREIQTGIGPLSVRVPRARDRGGEGFSFSSSLLPPYLRKSRSIEELLPWLYLKGLSTNDMQEALSALLGTDAPGLSSSTICRLKSEWEQECDEWGKESLTKKEYVYVWADGIHCGIRGEDERMCLLVLMGVTETGHKEIIALDSGYRESTESWLAFLRGLKERGMVAPLLAVGDGALGFWKALSEVFPATQHQRCWQHKTLNVLDRLPKSLRDKGLSLLRDIWMAPTKNAALTAWNVFCATFKDKYPKAVETLEKDKVKLLTFYNFPALHWRSLRTTNPIESAFATVRHRSSKAKGCVSRRSMLAFAFKLMQSAQKKWNRLAGFNQLAEVIRGVVFTDGVAQKKKTNDTNINHERVAA
jgi:transposase-like protein